MGLKVTWRAGNAYATGTVQGRRIRQSLGTRDKAQAEQARAELEARIWRQSVYGDPEVRTFEEAALSYMEAGGEARFLAPLIAHFRGVKVASIRPGHVRDAARRLYPKASPATQKRQAVTPAMAVINHAHDKGWCGLIRVRMKAGKPTPRVAVKRDYIDALRAACLAHKPPARHLAAMMLFLYQTGARIGEAIALTPADVDLDQALAFAENTKNGHPRRFELTSEIVGDLRRLRPREGRVFGYATRNGVYRALRAVCAEAELPYLATHQPGRHSFATALDALGFSAAAIAKAGNWRSVQLVAQTYTHPENAGRAAADALDNGTKLTQGGGE
jgi:integrase